MKYTLLLLFVSLWAIPAIAQKGEAKSVLDKTAAAFRQAGGVEVTFTIKIQAKGQADGLMSGNLRLKGDKFMLKTRDAITWFDGETQWSYLTDSEEVNISNPTEEELQSINPYALLSMYEKGFSHSMGKKRTYQNRAVYEVILTATDKSKEIRRITLYITRDAYKPVYILAEMNNNSRNEIAITGYKEGLTLADTEFVFDAKQYPRAEIIDLR